MVPGAGGAGGNGYGPGPGFGSGGYAALAAGSTASPLSENETADILFMREEEQMAYDLYARWGTNYSQPIFKNIARSESVHISRVQALIDRYYPGTYRIGNASAGYTDARIQQMYDTLGPVGDASLHNALESGLVVEDRDIEDLDRANRKYHSSGYSRCLAGTPGRIRKPPAGILTGTGQVRLISGKYFFLKKWYREVLFRLLPGKSRSRATTSHRPFPRSPVSFLPSGYGPG